jgi:hypothetical protein
VATRGSAVAVANVHTDGVARRRDLRLLTAAVAADVNHVSDGERVLPEVHEAAPLTRLGEDGPVAEGAVAKELVELIVGEALGGGAGVRDVLGRDVASGGGVVVLGEGEEPTRAPPCTLEGIPEARGMGGRSALEGESVGGTDETGRLEVRDAARRGRVTRENHVFNIVDVEVEGRVPKDDLLVGSQKEGVGVKAAVHADRFQTHGKAGEVEPTMLLDNFST